MALNSNYGYPPSGQSSPYSSTPTGIRTQRPQFGYSGLSMYPKSRSIGSDIHTDSFSDSMVNNYGTSTSRIDTSFNSGNRSSFNDSYNTSGSNYYSANSSFSHGQSYGETSLMHEYNLRENGGLTRDNSMTYKSQNVTRGGYLGNLSSMSMRPFPRSDTSNSVFISKPPILNPQFDASKYSSTFGMNNVGEFKGNFQKNSTFPNRNKKPYFGRNQGKQKKMATTKGPAWRCALCSLDFTSQIPYDMHFRGAKHAKKIKTQQALLAVQSQVNSTTVKSEDDKKTFFCELCNIKANSSLQLRTHLDGTKHKSKLQPKPDSSQPETQEGSKDNESTPVNGKTNGSLVRTLPSDFGEPQPSKLAKYACEVCNVAVNSETQLQQHLSSKKHQNKVEGKPVIKAKRVKKDSESDTPPETDTKDTKEETSVEETSNETSTKVVGVKTLASSFVQGETLQ